MSASAHVGFYLGWSEGAFDQQYIGAVQLVIAKKAMAQRVADDQVPANHVVTTGLENRCGCTCPTLSCLFGGFLRAGVVVNDEPAFGKALPDQGEDSADIPFDTR
jgi:hypothetical protein